MAEVIRYTDHAIGFRSGQDDEREAILLILQNFQRVNRLKNPETAVVIGEIIERVKKRNVC